MYSRSFYQQQSFPPHGTANIPLISGLTDSTYNYSEYNMSHVNRSNSDGINYLQYQPSTLRSEIQSNPKLKLVPSSKPINQLLEELFNITANKSLPNLEEVQMCKSKLKCHPKANSLFSVLSELKEGNCNLNGLVFGDVQENIRNLQCIKYTALSRNQDNTQSENQRIRLDNMLAAEGIINREVGPSTEDKAISVDLLTQCPKGDTDAQGNSDYYGKLSQIRGVYSQEATKIDEELNIFPKHVSNILRQQSEIRPIRPLEIQLMQRTVNIKYSILHLHLKQKTCEAIMVLRTKCLDARRKRRNFSKKSSEILNEFFFANVAHPYPSEEDKQELAKKCGITVSQVCNWFGNRRIRYKKNIDRTQEEANFYRKGNLVEHIAYSPPPSQAAWAEPGYSGGKLLREHDITVSSNLNKYHSQM